MQKRAREKYNSEKVAALASGHRKPARPTVIAFHLHELVYAEDATSLFRYLEEYPDCNVDEKDTQPNSGFTPLLLACGRGAFDCAFVLVEKGANMEYESGGAGTPLIYASWHGHTQIITLLLSKGCNVNQPNQYGNTPLHYASQHCQPDAVAILLKAGANVNFENSLQSTPLRMMTMMGGIDAEDEGDDTDEAYRLREIRAVGIKNNIATMLLGAGANPDDLISRPFDMSSF